MSLAGDGLTGPPSESSAAPPLFSLRTELDWRDALAWESLPRELTRREFWAYIGVLVLFGMALGVAGEHLPDLVHRLPELLLLLVVVAVAHLVWMLGSGLARRRVARRRFPAPVQTVVEDRGDHLFLGLGAEGAVMRPQAIRQVVQTAHHVFVKDADRLAIVPLRACDAEAARAFAERWQRLSQSAPD